MQKFDVRRLGPMALSLVLLLPPLLYYRAQRQRPPASNTSQPLFQGIDYERRVTSTPRPQVLHMVTVDLRAPGVNPLVTPLSDGPEGEASREPSQRQAIASNTAHGFMAQFGVQLAVNANYFYEFREKTYWEFYPRPGEPVIAIGEARGTVISAADSAQVTDFTQAVTPGQSYGKPQENWPALCFQPDHRATIAPSGRCPDITLQAIAGRDLLVDQGQVIPLNKPSDRPYARMAMGIDAAGETLWIVAVDGKQPYYSEGMRLQELAAVFAGLGVEQAIAVDGGGSTTLAVQTDSGPTTLNAPIHTKWPMRQRPVANHLGFYAWPLASE